MMLEKQLEILVNSAFEQAKEQFWLTLLGDLKKTYSKAYLIKHEESIRHYVEEREKYLGEHNFAEYLAKRDELTNGNKILNALGETLPQTLVNVGSGELLGLGTVFGNSDPNEPTIVDIMHGQQADDTFAQKQYLDGYEVSETPN
jgi:hypothetical protein